jgi:hypothetical protein
MPIGDLSGWKQVFKDDFTKDATLGSWSYNDNDYNSDRVVYTGDYGGQWKTYPDGWPDTNRNQSEYRPSRVVSVANGKMNLWLHSENGKAMGAVPFPFIGTPNSNSSADTDQLYGKYVIRFRSDAVKGYKTAWLLWPQSGNWPYDGELDFPEGDLNSFMHRQNGTAGSDQDYFGTGKTYTSWHTATIEWSPNKLVYDLDGQQATFTSRVPNTPMHYVMQTETCMFGCQDLTTAGNLEVDWITIYQYSPGTVASGGVTSVPTLALTATPKPTITPAPTVKPTPTTLPTPIPAPSFSTNTYVEAEAGNIRLPFKKYNGSVYQTTNNQGNAAAGGAATYVFTVPTAGVYTLEALVNAPTLASDSVSVNIDNQPQDPSMVWDIRLTHGVELRRLSWRGTGSADASNQQYNPKVFTLTAGRHTVIIRGREANVQIDKIRLISMVSGISATYFDNQNFTGTSKVQIDPTINFDWGSGSPVAGISNDTFSVRWTGFVLPTTSETYTFTTTSDDGVRLWVNNQRLVDQWKDQGSTDYSGSLYLEAGRLYPVTMEFYDNAFQAVAKLMWSSPTIPKQIIPQSRLLTQ